MVGYGGSFVRGNTIFLNPLTPSGTLDFNYQTAVRVDRDRYLSRVHLQNVLELLRVQPSGKYKSIWTGGDSVAGL